VIEDQKQKAVIVEGRGAEEMGTFFYIGTNFNNLPRKYDGQLIVRLWVQKVFWHALYAVSGDQKLRLAIYVKIRLSDV
jgi:hypothetical protein